MAINTLDKPQNQQLVRFIVSAILNKIKTKHQKTYLREINNIFRRRFLKIAFIILLVLLPFSIFDFSYYAFLTSSEFVRSPYVSFQSEWRSTDRIVRREVGCDIVRGDVSLFYILTFDDGATFDVFSDGTTIRDLAAVELFDARLQARGIPKERRWISGSVILPARYAKHPDCPRALTREFGEALARRYFSLATPTREPDDLEPASQ